LLIAVAPIRAALVTAVPKSARLFELASTSRMLHCGQTAETISMSRLISCPQPTSAAGSGEVSPFWFTFRKQPDSVVHSGSSNWAR
jgi:hypothetical protein